MRSEIVLFITRLFHWRSRRHPSSKSVTSPVTQGSGEVALGVCWVFVDRLGQWKIYEVRFFHHRPLPRKSDNCTGNQLSGNEPSLFRESEFIIFIKLHQIPWSTAAC